tara:strand:- start:77697 stop:78155 length:459 start_codon:yes stop_codon:yes gene_type:complete
MNMKRRMNDRGFVDTRLLVAGFSLFLLLIILFALSRAYGLVQGPHIELNEEVLYSQIDDGFIVLEGKVYRNAHFEINGRTVAPEQNGNFSERLLLSSGHTIMTIRARDRFDRTTQEIIPIYIPEYASEETSSQKDNEEGGGSEGEPEGGEEQ